MSVCLLVCLLVTKTKCECSVAIPLLPTRLQLWGSVYSLISEVTKDFTLALFLFLTGVLVYLIPDFSKLLDLQVWADAGQQIFFSLSLSQSVLGTLSSFNDFHQQCLTNTIIVVVVNCVTSFWIGFPIFAVLGHMAHELGTTVGNVTKRNE